MGGSWDHGSVQKVKPFSQDPYTSTSRMCGWINCDYPTTL